MIYPYLNSLYQQEYELSSLKQMFILIFCLFAVSGMSLKDHVGIITCNYEFFKVYKAFDLATLLYFKYF